MTAAVARPPGPVDSEHVLRTWSSPGPDDDPAHTRPKVYTVTRFEDGAVAFCKADSASEYVAHEAAVLRALAGVAGVPQLIRETPTRLCTQYVGSRALQDALGGRGAIACARAGWQVLLTVWRVHARGVVHADIRPWNFLQGDDGRVYLIDFEYAYETHRPAPALLQVHHYEGLKTRLTDWIDTWQSLADLWAAQRSYLARSALSPVARGVYWALRLWRTPQRWWERGGPFRS